ncbi:MAG: hypothetical protein ACI4PP_06770 [Clostridia bacterium]
MPKMKHLTLETEIDTKSEEDYSFETFSSGASTGVSFNDLIAEITVIKEFSGKTANSLGATVEHINDCCSKICAALQGIDTDIGTLLRSAETETLKAARTIAELSYICDDILLAISN